ncbi:unnamed protein product [Candidula unifasciata]|uniref:Glycine N-acyltransferase-like protein n=1 Tax=Candidula unifasciata TaxID=100452 RepID=A0A8S3ZN08_9EUPU|nr:unnamed protein product [Candidula unifasciata]
MQPLHKVTPEELPVLLEWAAQHLPGAQKIYGTVKEELNGRWQGPTYYTLGWPEILAVGEGPVDASRSQCADFFNDTRHTCVYSPNPEHVEKLLRRPEFLDWTRPIMFHATDPDSVNVVEKISSSTGGQFSQRMSFNLFAAYPGEIAPRPVPDGFELRQLDPDQDAEFVTSTWAYRRNYTVPYVREVLSNFPSVGIFNRQGECVALEIMSEFGTAVLLFTREDHRGRGLASCVVSQLAQRFFQENKPILATVSPQNKAAMDMHQKLGFKVIGKLCWFVHAITSDKVFIAL